MTTKRHRIKRVRELTAAQARRTFDRAARRHLGMSGAEFLRQWEAGAYDGANLDVPGLMDVVALLPLVSPAWPYDRLKKGGA
jgi:hypothetical protein